MIDGLKGKRQRELAGENPRSDTVTDLTGASRKKVPGGRNSAHLKLLILHLQRFPAPVQSGQKY